MFLKKLYATQKFTYLFAILITVLLTLFFAPLTYAEDETEGEKLTIYALEQLQKGLIEKGVFINRDPPYPSYMKMRVVGETKAIGIYLFSSSLHAKEDLLTNKSLLDKVTDMIAIGLDKMHRAIGDATDQGPIVELINSSEETIHAVIIFSSSSFYPENYELVYQTTGLIGQGVLDKDAPITGDGMPLLVYASQIGDTETVNELIGIGANVNKPRDSDGKTPLLAASANGHDAVVEILLENNATVSLVDRKGRTPLMLAAR